MLRIFGPKRDKVTGEWRKLHKEELNLYSPNIVRVIKSRRMKWAGHVARMGEGRIVYRILVGKPERDHMGDPGVDGRIIDGSSGSGMCGSSWLLQAFVIGERSLQLLTRGIS